MNPPDQALWHALSSLFLADPRCLVSPGMLRMLLRAEGGARLRVAGDRMWPAIAHGSEFRVVPLAPAEARAGDCVIALVDELPELARINRVDGGGGIRLVADADPAPLGTVDADALLARAVVPRRRFRPGVAAFRRRLLDFREAWAGRPDPTDDRAGTVHEKYDYQAPFYARAAMRSSTELLDRVGGDRVLVVGSGSGTEANDLARRGHDVVGLDFSQPMVDVSIENARREGVSSRFVCADARFWDPQGLRFDSVLFTYDVYSFVPRRVDRVRMLTRLHRWLAPGGSVLLSARMTSGIYAASLLRLGWVSRSRETDTEPGDSHTRWVDGAGDIRRSFIHRFSKSALTQELREAAFRPTITEAGHTSLERVGLL